MPHAISTSGDNQGSALQRSIYEHYDSSSVIYPLITVLPKLLVLGISACLIVLVSNRTAGYWKKWSAALVISAFVFFLCKPVLDSVFNTILVSLSARSSPSLYDPPYDYHILIPAYLSFLEPVIATFFAAALAWNRLPTQPLRRIALFTLLISCRAPDQHLVCRFQTIDGRHERGSIFFRSCDPWATRRYHLDCGI